GRRRRPGWGRDPRPGVARRAARCSGSRRSGTSCRWSPVHPVPGAVPGLIAIPIRLDDRLIPLDVIQSLEDRLQWDPVVLGPFLGGVRIRPVEILIDPVGPDPPPLQEELAVTRARACLQVLVLSLRIDRHEYSLRISRSLYPRVPVGTRR